MAFDPKSVVQQYGTPADEVRACRTGCALFDFSFVARARVEGPGALDAIGCLTRRPLRDLQVGQIRYAVREDQSGHLVSDLTVWRHEGHYEVMGGRTEDIGDLMRAGVAGCTVQDLGSDTAIFALQGPKSRWAWVSPCVATSRPAWRYAIRPARSPTSASCHARSSIQTNAGREPRGT